MLLFQILRILNSTTTWSHVFQIKDLGGVQLGVRNQNVLSGSCLSRTPRSEQEVSEHW
jgi:hypothetical protein